MVSRLTWVGGREWWSRNEKGSENKENPPGIPDSDYV